MSFGRNCIILFVIIWNNNNNNNNDNIWNRNNVYCDGRDITALEQHHQDGSKNKLKNWKFK